jgi:hypothetical protein
LDGIYTNVFIKEKMIKDDFFYIYKHINFDVDEIFEKFQNIFTMNWFSYQNIAIDETIFLFKGNYKYRQKIPNKPHNTGIELIK